MKKNQKGSATVLVMLILLCLTTFGVLAVVSAWSELRLSRKNAAFAEAYYQLDSGGEAALLDADAALKGAYVSSGGEKEYLEASQAALISLGWQEAGEGMSRVVSVGLEDKELYLTVVLRPVYDEHARYEILSWKQWQDRFVYDVEEGEGIRIR